MRKITINSTLTKTYKTVANLEKALEKLNLPEIGFTYLECYTYDGRVTAVFTNVTSGGNDRHMYLAHILSNGFKVVG